MGQFMHAVEDEMLCSSVLKDKVPYFNAPIYLENKSAIGKVDEILGPINEVYFSIKMGEGMVASSFKKGDKVYIGADKLLPLERFLPKPKEAKGVWVRSSGPFSSVIFIDPYFGQLPNCTYRSAPLCLSF
jgi:H/ACA ribonucleoprotein complex subunit 1